MKIGAHLCVVIDTTTNKVTSANIYSSGPGSLTTMRGTMFAELMFFEGEFAVAREQMLKHLKDFPERYGWLAQWMPELVP